MLRPRRSISPPLLRAHDRGHRPGCGMSVRRPLLAQASSHHPRGRARVRRRPRPQRGGGAGDRGHGVRRIRQARMRRRRRSPPTRGPALRRHRRPGQQVGHGREVDRERTLRYRHARWPVRGPRHRRFDRGPDGGCLGPDSPGRARRRRSRDTRERRSCPDRRGGRGGDEAGRRTPGAEQVHGLGGFGSVVRGPVQGRGRVHRRERPSRAGAPRGPDRGFDGRGPTVLELRRPVRGRRLRRGTGRLRRGAESHTPHGRDRAVHRRPVRVQLPQDQDVDEDRRRCRGGVPGHGRGLRSHGEVGGA